MVHFIDLAEVGTDLDGGLLVDKKSELFHFGFEWSKNGAESSTIIQSTLPGIGVKSIHDDII